MNLEDTINFSSAEKIQRLKTMLKSPKDRLLLLPYIGSGLNGAQLEISKRIVFTRWY